MAGLNLVSSAALLSSAAFVSSVSQASLRPVYGAINAQVNHREAVLITSSLGFLIGTYHRGTGPEVLPYLTVWAFWTLVLQNYENEFSGSLGPIGGPIISGLTSCHVFIILATYSIGSWLQNVDLQRRVGTYLAIFMPPVLGAFLFAWLEKFLSTWYSSHYFRGGPAEAQLGTAFSLWGVWASREPARVKTWKTYAFILPAIFHAWYMNPHIYGYANNSGVQSALARQNWTLLDRQWSVTGYLSVLENTERNYRVLRCDHSLLGGEWLLTPERKHNEGWKTTEPIYSVFEMLEAVRLMNVSPRIPDSKAKALVIGLGIGTAPTALIAHGVDTTIVELDPVVHAFATEFFHLPENHTAVLQDAVTWVDDAVSTPYTPRYDYILHDVFTGGAEPLVLFNLQFIQNLRALLTPNGVAAINYAGDLALPLTGRILNTILRAFDGQCKIFRDGAAPTENEAGQVDGGDFVNMVVFCRNKPGSITFRQPVAADYLESKSRQHYLLPHADHEIPFPLLDVGEVLRKDEESQWNKEQAESAMRHWRIMRTVLPDRVWELW